MDPWTSESRNEFIKYVKNTDDNKGYHGPYGFMCFPKTSGVDQEDVRRKYVTDALAKTLYNSSNPYFRRLSVGFYNTLVNKLSTNQYTGPYMGKDIIVLVKGGNTYAYITEEQFPEEFPFSDLDIVVYINPFIEIGFFEHLSGIVKITVLQTISQYKRMLDHQLFINKSIDDKILDDNDIAEFKKEYTKNIDNISVPNAFFVSPFKSDEIRNECSRNSFILTRSIKKENTVVKIDLPHFDRCERIPLRRTPLFSSYNDTIDFMRDSDATMQGHFDLYRIRLNNLYVEKDDEGNIIKQEKVASDFIDVSIASRDDAELHDFWKRGRCLSIYDKYANTWMSMPDIHSCINDLYKMLNIYECPDGKKDKRQKKYNKLIELASSRF